MLSILHLLDGDAGWEERTALDLLDRTPSDVLRQTRACISARAIGEMNGSPARPRPALKILGRCDRWPVLSAPAVARARTRLGDPVVHAWGVRAALAARASGAARIVLTLFDPFHAAKNAKRIRQLAEAPGFAVVCSCEMVKRRLVESGVAPTSTVLIRPGVDFAAINRVRRAGIREALGVPSGEMFVVLPEPVCRRGGHVDSFWAVHVLRLIDGGVRCAVPGPSATRDRIERLDRSLFGETALVPVPADVGFEQLVCAGDALVVGGHGDASTSCIAWAMAADTLVVAAATYCTAELIGSGLNGLLYKPVRQRSAAPEIMRHLRATASHAKLKEVARGHAYEVFGARRNIEQYGRLYENLVEGVEPGAGIADSAA